MTGETMLRAGANRPVQRQRLTGGWTKARRERFLDHVAATCNVREATEIIGLSQASVYALRRREPAFADQWRMALLAGYDRLEAELLRKAISTLDGVAIGDPDAVVGGTISVEQAIRMLDRHYAQSRGARSPGRHARGQATQAETDAELIRRLKMMKQQQERRA